MTYRKHTQLFIYRPGTFNQAALLKTPYDEQANVITRQQADGPDPDYIIGYAEDVLRLIGDLQALAGQMLPRSLDDPIWKKVATDRDVDSYERDRCPCVTCIQKAELINRIRQDATAVALLTEKVKELQSELAQLHESCATYEEGRPKYSAEGAADFEAYSEVKAPSFCQWPGCGGESFCVSGNFGGLVVCRDHFRITNGGDFSAIAGEQIREGDALIMRDGKAYRA